MNSQPRGIKYIRLESSFRLPTPDDFDDCIAGMDQDIKEEGGPAAFLGTIRSARTNWESMENGVIRPLVRHAFNFEDPLYSGRPPQTNLEISRAAFSGMLFGHILNEGLYPRMQSVRPYNTNTPINAALISESSNFEALWAKDQPLAYGLGVQAMSSLFIGSLSTQSLEILSAWGESMVGERRTGYFNFGFGTSLYLAWDAYSDMVLASGGAEQVTQYIAANLTK